MAYKDFDGLDSGHSPDGLHNTLQAEGSVVQLPDSSFVRDADMSRNGMDLILEGPHGTIVIKGYFASENPPSMMGPDGATLTPDLVNSFLKSPQEYAANETANDASPVGEVSEVTGEVTVTRADGSVETLTMGSPIYQGDIIETSAEGAVNIVFIDETSFAVSEDARLSIDEYVFDPSTESGSQNFSVLKGLFVFTSGLIGRDDPDDVQIDTPVGSIGIRGTIIAGNANTGEITVIEGAIVLRDFGGNEMTLATQFETARFDDEDGIQNMGQMSAEDMSQTFSSLSNVSPRLFSSIQDAGSESPSDSGSQGGDGDGTAPTQPQGSDPGGDSGLNGSQGGFGDTGGFGSPGSGSQSGSSGSGSSSGSSSSGSSSGSGSGGDSGGSTAGSGSEPPPPPPPQSPPPPPPPVNVQPVFMGLPSGHPIFTAGEQMTWTFDLGKGFFDPDRTPGGLTFELSQETLNILADLKTGGWLNLSGAHSDGYDFNPLNGKLTLFFNDFSGAPPTWQGVQIDDGGNITFDLSVIAHDAANGSASATYNFTAYNADTVVDFSLAPDGFYYEVDGNASVVSINDGVSQLQNLFISGENNTVFVHNGDNTITTLLGDNNSVYFTNGMNTVNIQSGTSDTLVVGGANNETFNINGLIETQLFGMAGNDTFILKTATSLSDLTSTSGIVIDGGGNAETSMHQILRSLASGGTASYGTLNLGDMLKVDLTGGQTINFQAIMDQGNHIHGIDVLNFNNNGSDTITLTTDSIISMTGPDNVLMIQIGAGTGDNDTLQIENWSSYSQMDLNGDGTVDANDIVDIGGINYSVFTDGNVTLFIQDSGSGTQTVTGI